MSKKQQPLGGWVAKRPAFLTLGAFVIGIMIGYPLETVSNGVIITILLVALMALVGVLVGRCLFLAWILGLVAFILIGAGITFSSRTNDSIVVSSNKKVVQATVSRVLSSNLDHRILLLKSGYLVWDRQSLPGYGRLSLRENTTPLMSGDLISFRSSIRAPVNRGNPGEYNWEVDCKSEGIAWLVSTHGPQSLVKLQAGCPYYPSALLSRLRRAMSAFIEKNSGAWFSERDATAIKAIHKGIILGDRAEIDGELTKAFSNSGLVHMLSASGSHVTIVAAVTLFVVKSVLRMVPNIMLWLPLPKIAAFFCIPTISVYCLLVGLKPPAMRAGLVGITLAVALITDRRWDSMNSLAFSAILILLFYPLSIFTPSFQLSFAAVAGILIIVQSPLFKFGSWTKEALEPRLDIHWSQIKKQPAWSIDMLKRPIISLVVSSLAATMAITPLIIHIFHSIPIYSIPANLASDFALTLGLSIGLISTLIGVISPLVGVYLMVPADFFVWLVIKIAVLTEKLPYAALQVPNLGYFGLVLSCITTGVTFYYIMRPKKDLGFVVISTWIILVITLMVGQVIQENSDKLKVVFLNVGNGDSAYIKAPGSSGFFIDTGPKTPYFDAGQSILTPFLLWQVVTKLDAIVISHPEADHMGGTLTTIKNFKTKKIFINPLRDSRDSFRDLVSFANSNGVEMVQAHASSDKIAIGQAFLTFLHPPNNFIRKKLNDMSVIVRLDYGNFSVLFTGDLEKEGEKELLNSGLNLKSTILKAPHHGGKTSASSREFLSKVGPKLAVLSAEYPPRGGLPNPEVVNKISEVGADILWTGRDGAITVSTDGINLLEVTTGKHSIKTSYPNFFDNSPN